MKKADRVLIVKTLCMMANELGNKDLWCHPKGKEPYATTLFASVIEKAALLGIIVEEWEGAKGTRKKPCMYLQPTNFIKPPKKEKS